MARNFIKEAIVKFKADVSGFTRGMAPMRRSFGALTRWTRNARAGLLGMNNMMMGQGAVMVGAGLAIRSSIRSMERYSNAQARLRGILASSNASVRIQHELMQASDVAARRYGFGLGEASEAMGTLLETGVSAHEAMRYFQVASEFSRAANVGLENSTRVIVDVMRQFQDQSEEGARRLAATLNTASRISSTSVEELQQSLRYAGVELSAMGFQADETAAALGAMSAIGLRGTTAGTRLRGAMLALTRITGRSRDIMQENNLEHERLDTILTDEQGNLRRITEVSAQLQSIFSDLPTQAARLNLATALFGRRAYAAGVILSGLHPQAAEFNRILGRLSDSEGMVESMSRAANEQMRGFGAQMRLARVAAEELGISFAQMVVGHTDDAEQGFGQYLRDLALAIRLSDENTRNNAIAQRQWEELGPAMRQSGREWRSTLEGLAELLRLLGRIGLAIGRFAGEYPRLTTALLIAGGVLRPFIALVGTGIPTAMVGATVATTAFGTALATVGGVLAGLALADYGSEIAASMLLPQEEGENYAQQIQRLRNETDEFLRDHGMGWAAQIPILRNVIHTVAALGRGFWGVASAMREVQVRRTQAQLAELQDASDVVEARMDRLRRTQDDHGMSESQMRRRAAGTLLGERMFSVAASMRARGVQSGMAVDEFTRMMRAQGVGEGQIDRMSERFARIFRSVNEQSARAELNRMRAGGLTIDEGRLTGQMIQAAQYVGTLGRFDAIENMNEALRSQQREGRGYAVPTESELQAARSELARRRPTATAPDRTEPVSTSEGTGPQEFNVAAQLDIQIPVQIDDREIARAAGRHNLHIDQRRGVTSGPGARRNVAQTGAQ